MLSHSAVVWWAFQIKGKLLNRNNNCLFQSAYLMQRTSSKKTLAPRTHKVFLYSSDCSVQCAHPALPAFLISCRPCVVTLTAQLVSKWWKFVLHFSGGQMGRATEPQGSFVVAAAWQVAAQPGRRTLRMDGEKKTQPVLLLLAQHWIAWFVCTKRQQKINLERTVFELVVVVSAYIEYN